MFNIVIYIVILTAHLIPNTICGAQVPVDVDQELTLRHQTLKQLRSLTLSEIREKISTANYNYRLCAPIPSLQEKYSQEITLLEQVKKEKCKENMRLYKKINKRIEKNEQESQILFSATKFHLESLTSTKKAVEEEMNKVFKDSQARLQQLKAKHNKLVLSQIPLDESPTSSPVSSDVEEDQKE